MLKYLNIARVYINSLMNFLYLCINYQLVQQKDSGKNYSTLDSNINLKGTDNEKDDETNNYEIA